MTGPVSARLEVELRELARQYGILVWLDKEGAYTTFADALAERAAAGTFPVPVRRFRGSYLELMLDLEDIEDGATMTPLIVHVPGHTEDSIAETPLYELYRAGRRHRRALATLVREVALGRANADALDTFLAGDKLTIEQADAWLAACDAALPSAGGPDLSAMSPESLFAALLPGGLLASRAAEASVIAAIRQRAAATLGVADSWYARWPEPGASATAAERTAALSLAIASWALCVEFVHDLRRLPTDELLDGMKALPRPAVTACHKLAEYLRSHHPDAYVQLADETEAHLEHEASHATAIDLGKIDTFRFEDRVVMVAALDALHGGQFRQAYDFARERTKANSFWPARVRGRQIAWQLVKLAAELGCAVLAHDDLLTKARTLPDAVEEYTDSGYEVDAAHRRLEQARHQLALLEIEEAGALRQRLDDMRRVYRTWADAVATRFNALCRATGFLPEAGLQQRTLFDEVVAPAAAEEVTAYFMVDALRFEMGKQLAESLESKTADVIIRARLAELPTVTEVGMNALAPIARDGKIVVDLKDGRIAGFRAASARVDSPKMRQQVIRERIGGSTCPMLSLEELLDRDVTSMRKAIARSSLVLVHCEGIDKAGEKGVGLSVFERELQNLRAAWRLLYEAGVKRFVFTADHGFLLHDGLTRDAQVRGKLTDPQRRHAISDQRRDQASEITVGATELGYEGETFFVSFPETTAPFDRGARAKDFVHGGNSLQERVIPVITVRQRHAAGSAIASYAIEARAGRKVAQMQCIEAKVLPSAQLGLSYGGTADVELVLETVGGTDVEVELCDAHGAQLTAGTVIARVGQEFAVYFRLSGDVEERVPIRIRHATRSQTVTAAVTEERFQVVLRTRAPAAAVAASTSLATDWLDSLPEGARKVFRHLAEHGSINEQEATQLLGGARQHRNFSLHLPEYEARAPFAVRIDMSSGIKCYVRGDR